MEHDIEVRGTGGSFERIRRITAAGNEYWSSREFAQVLEYSDYRNFETVVRKAKTACFNSGRRIEDHFVDITEMVDIGSGAQRAVQTVYMSRYACYLVIQNADPGKDVVALGQTCLMQRNNHFARFGKMAWISHE